MTHVTDDPQLPTSRCEIDPETKPYWEAAAAGRLVLPRCRHCTRVFWYPRGFCPHCSSCDLDWIESSGRGTIYSYTVVRRSSGEWSRVVPYALAFVTLDEGPTVAANIVATDTEMLEIGLPVEALFERSDRDDPPALRFRAA